jgi:hypothetical protein
LRSMCCSLWPWETLQQWRFAASTCQSRTERRGKIGEGLKQLLRIAMDMSILLVWFIGHCGISEDAIVFAITFEDLLGFQISIQPILSLRNPGANSSAFVCAFLRGPWHSSYFWQQAPKCMVYTVENPIKMDDLGVPAF